MSSVYLLDTSQKSILDPISGPAGMFKSQYETNTYLNL